MRLFYTLHPIFKIGKLVMLMQIFHISTFKRTHNPRIKFLIPSEKVKAWFSFCLKYFPMVSWLVSRNKWVLLLRRRNYISRCAVVAAPIFPLFRIYIDLYILLCHLTLKMQFYKILEFVFVTTELYSKIAKNMFLD